jgi:hypothetical protein
LAKLRAALELRPIPRNDDVNAVAIDVTPDFTVVLLLNYP